MAFYLDNVVFEKDNIKIRDTEARGLIQDNANDIASLKGRMNVAEKDIDKVEERLDTDEKTLADHEKRLGYAESDISFLKGRDIIHNQEIKELQDRADATDGKLSELDDRMEQAENDIDALNERVTDVENASEESSERIGRLEDTVEFLQSEDIIQNTKIRELEDDVNDLQADVADMDKRITASTYEAGEGIYFGQGKEHTNINVEDELLDEIHKNTADIADLKETVDGFDERITNAENKVEQVEKLVDELNDTVDDLSGRVSEAEQDIGDIQNDIIDIQEKDTEQDGRLTNLEQRVADNEKKDKEQDDKISALEQKDTEQDNRLTAVEQKDTEQDGKLNQLEQKDTEQDDRLTALESKDKEIGDKVDKNETDLSELEQRVSQAETEIDSLDARVESAEDSIIDLENNKTKLTKNSPKGSVYKQIPIDDAMISKKYELNPNYSEFDCITGRGIEIGTVIYNDDDTFNTTTLTVPAGTYNALVDNTKNFNTNNKQKKAYPRPVYLNVQGSTLPYQETVSYICNVGDVNNVVKGSPSVPESDIITFRALHISCDFVVNKAGIASDMMVKEYKPVSAHIEFYISENDEISNVIISKNEAGGGGKDTVVVTIPYASDSANYYVAKGLTFDLNSIEISDKDKLINAFNNWSGDLAVDVVVLFKQTNSSYVYMTKPTYIFYNDSVMATSFGGNICFEFYAESKKVADKISPYKFQLTVNTITKNTFCLINEYPCENIIVLKSESDTSAKLTGTNINNTISKFFKGYIDKPLYLVIVDNNNNYVLYTPVSLHRKTSDTGYLSAIFYSDNTYNIGSATITAKKWNMLSTPFTYYNDLVYGVVVTCTAL